MNRRRALPTRQSRYRSNGSVPFIRIFSCLYPIFFPPFVSRFPLSRFCSHDSAPLCTRDRFLSPPSLFVHVAVYQRARERDSHTRYQLAMELFRRGGRNICRKVYIMRLSSSSFSARRLMEQWSRSRRTFPRFSVSAVAVTLSYFRLPHRNSKVRLISGTKRSVAGDCFPESHPSVARNGNLPGEARMRDTVAHVTTKPDDDSRRCAAATAEKSVITLECAA